MFLPGADHLPVFTEHALPGTGRVDQDLIKISLKIRDKPSRLFAQDEYVSNSEEFQILEQPFCPGTAQIICRKNTCAVQLCSQLRRLSPGGCAYIQHPVPRFDRKAVCRSHSARLLEIVQSRKVIRVLCRLVFFPVIIKPVPDPRNRFERPGRDL